MPRIEWAAILWIVSGDPASYDRLHARLLHIARRSYGRDAFWPANVARRPERGSRLPAEDYVPDMVTLALMELRAPSEFYTHADRAGWFGLSADRWRRVLHKPYSTLQAKTFMWFGGGCTHIAKRLGDRQAA